MTKQIEIEGYDTFIPNNFYGKDALSIEHPFLSELSEIPVTQIIQLIKHKIPSETEVLNIIQKAAKELNLHSENKSSKKIYSYLKRFSPNEIKKIAEGEKEMLNHLKYHCSYPFQPQRNYILILSGIVPDKFLDMIAELKIEKAEKLYQNLIIDISKNRWCSALRLDGKGELPDKKELEYLLEKGVRDCDVFRTDVGYRNYSDMAEQLILVYNAINSKENLEKIKDFSHKILESIIEETLHNTTDCILKKRVMKKFAEGMMELLIGDFDSDFPEKEDGDFNFFDNWFEK